MLTVYSRGVGSKNAEAGAVSRSGIAGFQWTSASRARCTIQAGYRYYDQPLQPRQPLIRLLTTLVECEIENERNLHPKCSENIGRALKMSTIGSEADPVRVSEAVFDGGRIAPFGGDPSA